MKIKTSIKVVAAAIALLGTAVSQATVITINPTSDGSLYTCAGCNVVSEGAYVLTSGYIQGAIKFSSAQITGPVSQALLSVNPYGLPLWGPTVDIYGYGSNIGTLTASDANAGTFLGTLTLPANIGYGQDTFFDVTSFVNATQASFLAFNLRSVGTNVFSSLEYNYGHPSQLTVSTVPEPATLGLFGLGLLGIAAVRRNRKS